MTVLAGHAIWHKGKWHGGYRGQELAYEDHIKKAFDLVLSPLDRDHMLVLSGGHTRPELKINKTEAEGMYLYAKENAIARNDIEKRIIFELYARDSFENLFFSLLAFKKETGDWPQKVVVVSFDFKRTRFNAISKGLRLPAFRFFGFGDNYLPPEHKEKAQISERNIINQIINKGELWDPLQRSLIFRKKREQRTSKGFLGEKKYLKKVEKDYGFGDLLNSLNQLEPGLSWQEIKWPWL